MMSTIEIRVANAQAEASARCGGHDDIYSAILCEALDAVADEFSATHPAEVERLVYGHPEYVSPELRVAADFRDQYDDGM